MWASASPAARPSSRRPASRRAWPRAAAAFVALAGPLDLLAAPRPLLTLDANPCPGLVDADIIGVLHRHIIAFQNQGGDWGIRRTRRQAGQQGAKTILAHRHPLAGFEDGGGGHLLP